MRTLQLSVDGMRCRPCVRRATALLRDVPGVATVTADSTTGRITLTGDVSDEAALAALAGTSFTARVTESTPPPDGDRQDRACGADNSSSSTAPRTVSFI